MEKKKYLYNTEKNAYVEITEENKESVKTKYKANPSLYKIYEIDEEAGGGASQGGGSMGKSVASSPKQEESVSETPSTTVSEAPSQPSLIPTLNREEVDASIVQQEPSAIPDMSEMLETFSKERKQIIDRLTPEQLGDVIETSNAASARLYSELGQAKRTNNRNAIPELQKQYEEVKAEGTAARVKKIADDKNTSGYDDFFSMYSALPPAYKDALQDDKNAYEEEVRKQSKIEFTDLDDLKKKTDEKVKELGGGSKMWNLVYNYNKGEKEAEAFREKLMEDKGVQQALESLGKEKTELFKLSDNYLKLDNQAREIQNEYVGVIKVEDDALYSVYTLDLSKTREEIEQQLEQGALTPELAQKKLEEENIKLYGQYQNERKNLSSKLQTEYDRKLASIDKAIQDEFSAWQKADLSPEQQKTIEAAFKKASNDIVESDRASALIKDITTQTIYGRGAILAKSYLASLGRSVAAYSTTFGIPDGVVFGDKMAKSMEVADMPMKEWSDLFDLDKMTRSTGNLAGSMTFSMGATAAAAVATGGLGAIPALATSAVVANAAETADMAAQMYRDVLRETGSETKAAAARKEMVNSQMDMWWTYTLSGLPFVDKALKGLKPILRPIVGGVIEQAEETIQETMQGAREEAIKETGRFQDAEYTLEGIKQTALTVAPTFLMGAGGQVRGAVSDASMEKQAKQYGAKLAAAEISSTGLQQHLVSVYQQGGKTMAKAVVGGWAENLSNADTKTMFDFIETIASDESDARAFGLNEDNSYVYFSLLNKYRQDKASAEKVNEDTPMRDILMERAKESKANAEEFLRTGQGKYAVVTIGDERIVLTEQETAEFVATAPEGYSIEAKGFDVGQYIPKVEEVTQETTQKEVVTEAVLDNKQKFNEISTKAQRGEAINAEELQLGIDEAYSALDELEGSTSEDAEILRTLIEEEIEKLESYDNTTEVKTSEAPKTEPIRRIREIKREQTKTPQERIEGRRVRRVEGDEFFATVAPIEGEQAVSVIERNEEGILVLQEYDSEGNKGIGQPLEAKSMNDFDLVETTKDENGNVTGAILRNKNNDAEAFAIDDADLALDLAIEKTRAELGFVEIEELDIAIEEAVKEQPVKEIKKKKETSKIRDTSKTLEDLRAKVLAKLPQTGATRMGVGVTDADIVNFIFDAAQALVQAGYNVADAIKSAVDTVSSVANIDKDAYTKAVRNKFTQAKSAATREATSQRIDELKNTLQKFVDSVKDESEFADAKEYRKHLAEKSDIIQKAFEKGIVKEKTPQAKIEFMNDFVKAMKELGIKGYNVNEVNRILKAANTNNIGKSVAELTKNLIDKQAYAEKKEIAKKILKIAAKAKGKRKDKTQASLVGEQAEKDIREIMDLYSGTDLNDLTYSELNDILDELEAIAETGRGNVKAMKALRQQKNAAIKYWIASEAGNAKVSKDFKETSEAFNRSAIVIVNGGVFTKANRKQFKERYENAPFEATIYERAVKAKSNLATWAKTPYYAGHTFAMFLRNIATNKKGLDIADEIHTRLMKGYYKRDALRYKYNDAHNKALKDVRSKLNQKVEILDARGDKLKMTKGEVVQVVMTAMRDSQIDKVLTTFPQSSLDEMVKIVQDPQLKEYMDFLWDTYEKFRVEELNPFLERRGIKTIERVKSADVKNDNWRNLAQSIYGAIPEFVPYSPSYIESDTKSDYEYGLIEESVSKGDFSSYFSGRLKPTRQGGEVKADIKANVAFVDYIKEMSHMVSLDESYDDLTAILSQMPTLEGKYGKGFTSLFKAMIKKIVVDRSPSNSVTRAFKKLVLPQAAVTMFGNLASATYQVLSFPNAALEDGVFFEYVKNFFTMGSRSNMLAMQELLSDSSIRQRLKDLGSSEDYLNLTKADNPTKFDMYKQRILKYGYTPTQLADFYTVIVGSTPYYAAMKKKVGAEKAMEMTYKRTQETQQTKLESEKSAIQSSTIGSFLTTFGVVSMSYSRRAQAATRDLVNGRGNPAENIAKIVYYIGVQNAIFNLLQSGVIFYVGGDDDENKRKKVATSANRILDSFLIGYGGIYGVGGKIVKNVAYDMVLKGLSDKAFNREATIEDRKEAIELVAFLTFSSPMFADLIGLSEQEAKLQTNNALKDARRTDVYKSLANEVPLLSIAARKYNNAVRAYGKSDYIKASALMLEAIFAVPFDRVLSKTESISDAINEDLEWWQRIARGMNLLRKYDMGNIKPKEKRPESTRAIQKTPINKSSGINKTGIDKSK